VPVRLYARRPEVRDRLAARGATVTDDLAAAVKGAELCVLCLFSAEQLEEVALGENGVLANLAEGGLAVVHTTVPPDTLHKLGDEASKGGVRIVDAPVSGTADAIRAGELTVLLGGPPEALDRCEPVIGAYAGTMLRLGDVGTATKLKLINNLVFAAHTQIAESAVRLGERMGIASADLAEALGSCSGDSRVFGYMRANGADIFVKSERYLRKDVAAVNEAAGNAGIDLGFLHRVVKDGPLGLAE
jgi:3-hydroxyisobutyrate dehydrogenase-like beta-hydroxyacid dehydrogenase